MDAAEIARLREQAKFVGQLRLPMPTAISLLDALEQARKEREKLRDKVRRAGEECDQWRVDSTELQLERDQAQKDAKDARALLGDVDGAMKGLDHFAWSMVSLPLEARSNLQNKIDALRAARARIEAMLEQKP